MWPYREIEESVFESAKSVLSRLWRIQTCLYLQQLFKSIHLLLLSLFICQLLSPLHTTCQQSVKSKPMVFPFRYTHI